MRKIYIFLVFIFFGELSLANYENTIHYVWMGNLDTKEKQDIATLGPARLQELIDQTGRYRNAQINFWVRSHILDQAIEIFSSLPNVKVLSFDERFQSYRVKNFSPEEMKTFFKLVDYLEQRKRYAHQKDFVSQMIVAEYGGYFFDTTTYFRSWPKFDLFNNNLEKRIGLIMDKELFQRHYGAALAAQILFHTQTDVQIFSAPVKGDPMFVDAVKCGIEKWPEFEEKISAPGATQRAHAFVPSALDCLGTAAQKWYGQSADPWAYAWEMVIEPLPNNLTLEVNFFPWLSLFKLNAGSWRNQKGLPSEKYIKTVKAVKDLVKSDNQ